ncbi:MAG: HipA family kinase [Chloroflexota bacterium]|nr:HipA family kinase [Chloroflexota bacterium]
MLPTVRAVRYVAPLREGGSLPGLMEADDEGTYVVKYRGAGQGPKALVAELLAGEIGRALGLPVPDAVLLDLDPAFGRLEMDYEIQHLLRASEGINYALDFLPGSITYDPLVPPAPDPSFAADVIWFDAFVTNVDRTARNANMLDWHGDTWLIDHGASLYFHHDWGDVVSRVADPFERVRQHVMLPFAGDVTDADVRAHRQLSTGVFESILTALPDLWLAEHYGGEEPDAIRRRYLDYLVARLEGSGAFVEEAARVRALLV